MRLHRGIAVPGASAASTIATIGQDGLQRQTTGWGMIAQDLKPHIDRIWSLPSITSADVTLIEQDHAPRWVCACADNTSALFYACKHNVHKDDDTPLLITFDADISQVIIDGRDFLYPLFQIGNPEHARPIAVRLFGTAILRYVDRAWNTKRTDAEQRIAICSLAVQDEEVIAAHARNTAVIQGRHRTEFRSAFMARLPVEASRIAAVEKVRAKVVTFPTPEITLEMLR
jgi:hypothetical protein